MAGRPPGRPRTPISSEQAAYLARLQAGQTRWRWSDAERWRHHHGFMAAYRSLLLEREHQLQDQALALGAPLAAYQAALAVTLTAPHEWVGIWPRLRLLERAIRIAQHRQRRRQRTPRTWDQVRQRVYAETGGLLAL